MKITHHSHCDKWGISHKSIIKRDSEESSSSHNPSGCVDPPFQSTKGLAHDKYSYV
jgi:hypothetical protein